MNIGRLDRKIVIESYSLAKNAQFESVGTWATYHTCFANVQKAGGTEYVEADKVTATNKVKFKIRYFGGITEKMRIVYNSDYFDIIEIQELEREGLWITATKKV